MELRDGLEVYRLSLVALRFGGVAELRGLRGECRAQGFRVAACLIAGKVLGFGFWLA